MFWISTFLEEELLFVLSWVCVLENKKPCHVILRSHDEYFTTYECGLKLHAHTQLPTKCLKEGSGNIYFLARADLIFYSYIEKYNTEQNIFI